MIGPVGDFALFGAVIHGSTAAAISKFPFKLRGRTKLTFPTLHRAEVFTESAFCADFVLLHLSKCMNSLLFTTPAHQHMTWVALYPALFQADLYIVISEREKLSWAKV